MNQEQSTENDVEEQVIKVQRGEAFQDLDKEKKEGLRESFYDMIEVLKYYMDMKEEYYPIISLWIIGTYFYEQFLTYPYLFFNAMRGSGKSRVVELITHLSADGNYTQAPTEAVLFRTAGTLGLDEFENVGSRDKAGVRELLNASYKKGMKVMRMKKKKVNGQEEQVVDEFETYRPIVMANIWGMEEVLGDRCVQLILEKSNDDIKTRKVQDYQTNDTIENIKFTLERCRLCRVVSKKNIYTLWNVYLEEKETTLNTHTTYTTYTTQTTPQLLQNIKEDSLFNKIYESGIKGRNLELFFPLFLIANVIDEGLLKKVIKIAQDIVEAKTKEEEIESRDVQLLDFISIQKEKTYLSIKELTKEFQAFTDYEEEDINTKWFGRALKRLNLVIDKRRIGRGRDVVLDIEKAKEKFKMFKK